MHVLAEHRYNFIQTTNLADTATNRNAYLQSSAPSSKRHDSGVRRRARRPSNSTCAACHSGLTTQTRSFENTSVVVGTRYEYHALYKNSSTLKDRVTEYTVHILSKPWQKRATSRHHNASTTILRCRGGVVSFEKFRSCALLSLTCSCRRVKANDCLVFFFFCFFLRIFAAFVHCADQRSGWHTRHK